MDFQVNGGNFHSASGVFSVKPIFGLQSVIARTDSAAVASPSTPLGRVVVAPVDARGRFLVAHKAVYSVLTFQAQEDYKALLLRKLEREQHAKRSHETRGKTLRAPQRAPQRALRGSSAYTQFVGEFMKHFQNTSFTDASAAWRSLDSTSRKQCSTRDLIAKIVRKGRYELAVAKRT